MSSSNLLYSVSTRFPYLVEQNLDEGDQVARGAQLSWRIIEADVDKPFVSSGLEFVPLPVKISGYFELLLSDLVLLALLSGYLDFLSSGDARRGLCLFRLLVWQESESCVFIRCLKDSTQN